MTVTINKWEIETRKAIASYSLDYMTRVDILEIEHDIDDKVIGEIVSYSTMDDKVTIKPFKVKIYYGNRTYFNVTINGHKHRIYMTDCIRVY